MTMTESEVEPKTMIDDYTHVQRSWWKLVLTGCLAIALGIGLIVLPARIMFGRILDIIFGVAKPLSGGLTAIAALLSLLALVALDGLVHLFGAGVRDNRVTRLRGVLGVAVAVAALLWPGMTAYAAVQLIGLWAVLVGLLELYFVRHTGKDGRDRTPLIIAGIASIVLGVGVMMNAFAGAVLVSTIVGIAAAARGILLIISGFIERSRQFDAREAVRRDAA